MTAVSPTEARLRAQRRAALARHPRQMGLDYAYVELAGGAPRLVLRFVPGEGLPKEARPAALTADQIRLLGPGNSAQRRLHVVAVEAPADAPETLAVRLHDDLDLAAGAVDTPVFTVELVNVPLLDPFFSRADFALRGAPPVALDPWAPPAIQATSTPGPAIDYLARDYAGFRQLMLNRLATLMPAWRERQPADVGHALVEVIAYAADQLSYFQDAVATEAYLGTARRRVSVRRHARLLDYAMHEGCNARTWVHITVSHAELPLPAGSALLSRLAGAADPVLDPASYEATLITGATVFETMHETTLRATHNELTIHAWGLRDFGLAAGATSAALVGHVPGLAAGTPLLLESAMLSDGQAAADPTQRHVVRLSEPPRFDYDALGQPADDGDGRGLPITLVRWHGDDALPFAMAVSAGEERLAVARGNLVLADHGYTVRDEEPAPPLAGVGRYAPRLRRAGLTFAEPYDTELAAKPAALALIQDARRALPAIVELMGEQPGRAEAERWRPRRDLLGSDRFDRAFVVEAESDGAAQLRFGDGMHGRRPAPDEQFRVSYRIGQGQAGNVGHDALVHLAPGRDAYPALKAAVTGVRNPLPGVGGEDPEPIEQVRLYAPRATQRQQRCVVAKDFVALAESHPDVQKAAVVMRWTGSWQTAVVVVDRRGGRPVDAAFRAELLERFEPQRLAGSAITIRAPLFVSLDIALTAHLRPGFAAAAVRQALQEAFSAAELPGGRRGFFHPDSFTIAQPVYLSQIVAAAMDVPGVAWVEVTRFQRWGRHDPGAMADGVLTLGPLEVARVLNDPLAPSSGVFAVSVAEGS